MEKSENFLNTLVELARLGASGLAIFSIFWIGYLITRKSDSKNDQMHATLRLFMVYSGIIFIVLVGAGLWGTNAESAASEKRIAVLTNDHAVDIAKINSAHDAAITELKAAHDLTIKQAEAKLAAEITQIRDLTKTYRVQATVVEQGTGKPLPDAKAIAYPSPATADSSGTISDLYVRRVDTQGTGEYTFPKIMISSDGYSPQDVRLQSDLDSGKIKLEGNILKITSAIELPRAVKERKSP